jgi:hypothetical protein
MRAPYTSIEKKSHPDVRGALFLSGYPVFFLILRSPPAYGSSAECHFPIPLRCARIFAIRAPIPIGSISSDRSRFSVLTNAVAGGERT